MPKRSISDISSAIWTFAPEEERKKKILLDTWADDLLARRKKQVRRKHDRRIDALHDVDLFSGIGAFPYAFGKVCGKNAVAIELAADINAPACETSPTTKRTSPIVQRRKLGINLGKPKSNDDEWYTPRMALEMVCPYLPKDKVIWEAFTSGNNKLIESPKYLREIGHNVIATGDNFFTCDYGDIVVSNPPYATPRGEENIKTRIIRRLCDMDKPFALLLPTTYLQTKELKKLLASYNFQVIMPTRKIQFYKIRDGKKITKKSEGLKGCSFYTAWLTFKLKLPRDIIWI